MIAWLRQHGSSLFGTLRRLARTPFATALNVLVIGTALALPLAGYIALGYLQQVARASVVEPEISIFLDTDADASDVERIAAELKGASEVRAFRFVPKDKAFADLKRSRSLGAIVASLNQNPLPDAFVAALHQEAAEAAGPLSNRLKALPRVAHVQFDAAWAKRIRGIIDLGRAVTAVLGALLGLALVAVIFNTIRLQIMTQRDEIEVSRLVGATEAYIRRPFLYLGTLLGLGGGLTALALIGTGGLYLAQRVAVVANLYSLQADGVVFSPEDAVTVVLFSAALGLAGAWLSVSKHLQSAP